MTGSLTLPILAAFLTPTLAVGGAVAVAAPIVIHILARQRFRRIRWAATEFLIQAERKNRRRLRLEEWILLALRCLAVALIGAMVARPFFTSGAATVFGGLQRTERVLVIDDSLSMGYESPQGTSFARAKTAVKRLVDSIKQQSPDDTVTVLKTSAIDSPLDFGTYLDDAQTDALLARVEALSPTQRAADASQVIAGTAEVLGRNAGTLSAAVYVISDFQKNDWVGREAATDGATEANLLAPLLAWAEGKKSLRIVLVNVGDSGASNLAVTEVKKAGGPAVAGTEGVVKVQIANYSNRNVENLGLETSVSSLPQPGKTLPSLGSWQKATADIGVTYLRAGDETVKVSLPQDNLPADNSRHGVIDVVSAVRVLIVNGEPSADGFEDEAMFLATALRPEGEVFSGNDVQLADETQLETLDLSPFRVIVVANVYRLSDSAVAALERFAKLGGGVVFFSGDQVDPEVFNAAVYRNGEGLFPCKLTETVRADDGVRLVVKDRLHPVLHGVDREGDPLGLGRITFYQFIACDLEDENRSGKPAQGVGDGVAVNETQSGAANVVAAFSDEAEHPAIVERRFGAGRVIYIATSADKEWHSWPDHPTFLPVMIELMYYAAGPGRVSEDYFVGSTVEIPVPASEFEPDVVVRTPGYPAEREVGVTAVEREGGNGFAVKWSQANSAGVYQFVLKRRDGGEVVRQAAVNVDPRESDLSGVDEEALRRALHQTPFDYVNGLEELGEVAGEPHVEFWRPVLLTLFGLLMAEQGLAWFWGRRK